MSKYEIVLVSSENLAAHTISAADIFKSHGSHIRLFQGVFRQ